ncbi:putative receptor-like protein kinase [Dichanthelium oligosanthes]|uniref:Putative receptor-like protein kinase n=1 Tax=Dichanthelium oligosanthes TaxID=888268 RepID=A0A1E5VFB8_9POAL|nr:putative receptor-like protein kinase [Dichanthelium oligosanthes]
MANGSLESWLYPKLNNCGLKRPLSLSNVLLDDFMVSHVGDFGLAKFLYDYSDSTSLVGPRGSIGYIAPEYGFGSKISREGDIYSYGIIILELLTGKRPADEMFNVGLSLHKFVEKAFPRYIGEILYPNIIPNLEDDDMGDSLEHRNHATVGMMSSIMQLVKLGLSCSLETPKDRPTMLDVYAEVIEIKEELQELCG